MTEITEAMVEAHGLKPDEYERLLSIIGRAPSFTELGIFSAMWNEHCSYKSSKVHLRTLPTAGPHVICGPGENAGVVDIGDGQAVVFKMESHNHPSYIEPYQGAATGVGGILRDVFTMGARPVAAMNALSFGRPDHPKTRSLLAGVVAGIGGYGNAFGVPTVGGQLRFDAAYDGNCLVNAFAAGIADADAIFYSAASGVGRPVVYLGAKTGRDGVGGATMASAEFDDTIEEKRPTVQVGDPFTEKKLMEATLELMATGAVVSIQDMGAAGLTCSAVEMGDKGGLGIRLDLDAVPVREDGMSAYEMMLSESQERMLMVLDPEREAEARAVFEKWDLDFAIVGETIPEDRFLVVHRGETVADLPLSTLASSAPEYDRPWEETPHREAGPIPEMDALETARALVSDPGHAEKRWVWEQYDTTVMADTLVAPGRGAGVVRVHGTRKALVMACAVTPRYVEADPETGGAQAVAEAARMVRAKGALPLAVTDNLNFGNPEKPRIMGQLALAVRGIGAACEALGTPVVSGNVSLYNETDGAPILPTPTIGMVGLIEDHARLIPQRPSAGDVLVEIGGPGAHLHCTAVHRGGPPPPVDLAAEARAGAFVAARAGLTGAASIGSGGLFLAAFAMAAAEGLGIAFEDAGAPALFGEDQGRFALALAAPDADALVEAAGAEGIEARVAGRFTQGALSFGGAAADMDELAALWRGAIPGMMSTAA